MIVTPKYKYGYASEYDADVGEITFLSKNKKKWFVLFFFFFFVGVEVFFFLYILNYCLQQMGQEVLHPNSPYGIDQAMLLSHAYETVGIISEL